MAFAIPPRACINPGPETTRQTPGLPVRYPIADAA